MSLSSSHIESIARQVYSQFPEIKGARPSVQKQAGAKSGAGDANQFVLTFKGSGQGPGGQTIQRIVRVVADERGKVLKISTSR
jgi:hypothetical protein